VEAALLGLVLDSSILIAAERRKLTPVLVIESISKAVGETELALCPVTVAEIAHGVYRANTTELRERRRTFLDELKGTIPVHPITEVTAEIVGRIGGELAAKGINLPLGDLIIAACALELGFGVATRNLRDFRRIPDLEVVEV
jgi:tRNA(fMet)-specific endonuclease VapC